MPAELVVDPRFRLSYMTFVLQGFLEALDLRTPRWRKLDVTVPSGATHGCAMIVKSHGVERRIFVSTGDQPDISEEMLAWADAYGKVNIEPAVTDPRVVPIGPAFSVRLWSRPSAYYHAARLIAAGAARRATIGEARFQAITRLPLDSYTPGRSEDDYIFHLSRSWHTKHDAANQRRRRFVEAMEGFRIKLDGGLVDERMPLAEYLERTRRSTIAFNTPAVHACLGWKLGEYLALGKAIVSTPLNRRLPAPLVHGEHIHYVEDDVDSIREGVATVVDDPGYRATLERGAREWYERHLRPAVLADSLLAACSRQDTNVGSTGASDVDGN